MDRGRLKKLDALWIGPNKILEKNFDVNYTIKMGRRNLLTHVNRLKASTIKSTIKKKTDQ